MRAMSGPNAGTDHGLVVRGNLEYQKQLQLVREGTSHGVAHVEAEASGVLDEAGVSDIRSLKGWMQKRQKLLAMLIRQSDDPQKIKDWRFRKLVRQYVVVEHMCGSGEGLTLSWLKEAKFRARSKQWLHDSRQQSFEDVRQVARERQAQLKPLRDRTSVAAMPGTGFPECARVGCCNPTGEDSRDGKMRKTNFIVRDVEGGREIKVCRSCVTQANSQAKDPKAPGHISTKDSLCVNLGTETFSNFCVMAVERKHGKERRLKEVGAGRSGSGRKEARGKKQKTIREAIREQLEGERMVAGGHVARHKGTDADPILLSSSDDEDTGKKEKLYMAVVNPCQRQTRRTSKVDVETDPVLDKLKCFMPPEGGRGSIKFALRDFFKLRPMEFLNDSCIDYFLKGIEIRLKEELPHAWERCYFFNSFFYKKLTDNQSIVISEETKALAGMPLGEMDQASLQALRCYDLTKSWTKHVDLFEKDYLFIPICENLHWSLLIVCHPGRGIIKSTTTDPKVPGTFMMHLDSMRSHRAHDIGKLVKMYLQNEWNAKLRQDGESAAKRWVREHPGEERNFLRMTLRRPHVPLQDNHFDCGLFLCAFVDHFLAYLPRTMNEAKVPHRGRRLDKPNGTGRAVRYFPRVPTFLTNKWFSTNNVGNMRTDMALRVIRAMAVNAGIMDDHARWTTGKMLTQEQQHMMTYLMHQEEILKERKESYAKPEWLEVLSDEEDGNDQTEYGDGSSEKDETIATDHGKTDNDCISDDIDVCIDGGPGISPSNGVEPDALSGPKDGECNVSIALDAGSQDNHQMDDIVIDDPIEDPKQNDSHDGAMTPRESVALLKKVHANKRNRNTPSLQVVTDHCKGESKNSLDEAQRKMRRAARRPCPASVHPLDKRRGSLLVDHALAKSRSGWSKK